MSYKVCTRCQFVVPGKKKICTTCGSKKFQGDPLTAPAAKRASSEQPRPSMVAAAGTIYSSARATAPAARQFAGVEEVGGANNSNSLRDKFSFEDEALPTLWWTETWTKVRKALNI